MPSLDRRIESEQLAVGMTTDEMMMWAINQMFRSARHIDLLSITKGGGTQRDLMSRSLDITAKVMLKTLIKTKPGWETVRRVNPKLLRGYRKPSF